MLSLDVSLSSSSSSSSMEVPVIVPGVMLPHNGSVWWLVAALCYGYLVATLGESIFHQHIQHGSWKTWLFGHSSFSGFVDAKTSHELVHHIKTFRTNHVTQFADERERQQVSCLAPVCSARSHSCSVAGCIP